MFYLKVLMYRRLHNLALKMMSQMSRKHADAPEDLDLSLHIQLRSRSHLPV